MRLVARSSAEKPMKSRVAPTKSSPKNTTSANAPATGPLASARFAVRRMARPTLTCSSVSHGPDRGAKRWREAMDGEQAVGCDLMGGPAARYLRPRSAAVRQRVAHDQHRRQTVDRAQRG